MVNRNQGTLFVVSTPIGNMGDFSFRGVEILASADLVLAEDTRRVRQLLSYYKITAKVASYHERNEAAMVPRAIERLQAGENLALVSDAGTPVLSDPGERLVREALDRGIVVNAVPGASALLASLVVSGIPADHFTFHGFLPRKGAARAQLISQIAVSPWTVVLYEAPGRLAATLADLVAACGGERHAVVSRELTKLFEESRRGTLLEHVEYYEANTVRGEVVILVSGKDPEVVDENSWREVARSLSARGLSRKDVVSIMVREHGAPRNVAYRVAQEE